MMLRPFLSILLILMLATPLAAQTTSEPGSGSSGEVTSARLPAITVASVTMRRLQDRIIASGLVTPVEEVSVAPLVEGQPIEALLADVGDSVTEGQVLARLSSTTLELQKSQLLASSASAAAAMAQAEAQVTAATASAAEAERAATRAETLAKQGSMSATARDQALSAAVTATAQVTVATQSLEAARAQARLVEAQLANIDLQLTRTEVVAPFAGEITARNAMLGGIASAAAAPMFTLIRDGALELRADVAEVDMLRIAVGQTAALSVSGSTQPLTGTVRLVEPTIDATTRLGRARIAVDGDSPLRPGMFVTADITVADREAPTIPVTALSSSGGQATVMKVSDGIVALTPVQTGIREGGFVEILAGLAEGDLVVAKAGAFVRDGDRINPIQATDQTN
jgi:HlyD family secretion protein